MTDKDTIQMIRKDITERLRDRDNHDCIEAANEIERLQRERDEARNIALAYAAQDIVSNSSMGGTYESWRRLIAHRLRWEMPNESPEAIGQKGT